MHLSGGDMLQSCQFKGTAMVKCGVGTVFAIF